MFNYPPHKPSTYVDVLRWRALNQSDQRAFTFLTGGEDDAVHLTYRELDYQARAIGKYLQDNIGAGERVLLPLPPGLNYIEAFFGCLYAGVVAVPIYPPKSNTLQDRFNRMVKNSQPRAVLTTSEELNKVTKKVVLDSDILLTSIDSISSTLADLWRPPEIDGTTLAFLQYTSGSVGAPKGVMVSHKNIMANQLMIKEAFDHDESSVGVGWLPLYHDMGLIGNILQPIYSGFPITLMSPMSFLQKPVRWLKAISEYRATHSGGPNFSFDLCVDRISPEELNGVDLSSWRVAFNGAEPVRPETLERFHKTFKSVGFRQEAFLPCYGLAEATLFVSRSHISNTEYRISASNISWENQLFSTPRDYSSGNNQSYSPKDMTTPNTIVVNPNTLEECSENEIGEIWVSGPHVTCGYWNNPNETTKVFEAYLRDGSGPYLRTGDLGQLNKAQLYIAGRIKDVIIIRGSNYYPQDIEVGVEQSHPKIPLNGCAAFAIEHESEEKLVIVSEVYQTKERVELKDVIQSIREHISREHQLRIYAVVMIRFGTIPKTSSGKIQRNRCRELYEASALRVLEQSELGKDSYDERVPNCKGNHNQVKQGNDFESYLKHSISPILQLEPDGFDLKSSLLELGFDSLRIAELKQKIEDDFQVSLPVELFFQQQSVVDLANHLVEEYQLDNKQANHPPLDDDSHTQRNQQGMYLASFEQERLWLVSQLYKQSSHLNVPSVLEVSGTLNASLLEESANKVIAVHDSLRTTFEYTKEGLKAVLSDFRLTIPIIEVSTESIENLDPELDWITRNEIDKPFNLLSGPLLRLTLIQVKKDRHVLIICIHHIIADLTSLDIFIKDLFRAYKQSSQNKGVHLSAPSQYIYYSKWQRDMAASSKFDSSLAFWKQSLANPPEPLNISTKKALKKTKLYKCKNSLFEIRQDLVSQLVDLCRQQGATIFMLLAASLNATLYDYTLQSDIIIGTPYLGRSHPMYKNTIGFFAYPLLLRTNLGGDPTLLGLLERVRKTTIEIYNYKDVPFSLVVDAISLGNSGSRLPAVNVMFSFLDRQIGEMSLPNLKVRPIIHGKSQTEFDLFVTIIKTSEGLSGIVEYADELFEKAEISSFISSFQSLIQKYIRDPSAKLSSLNLLQI